MPYTSVLCELFNSANRQLCGLVVTKAFAVPAAAGIWTLLSLPFPSIHFPLPPYKTAALLPSLKPYCMNVTSPDISPQPGSERLSPWRIFFGMITSPAQTISRQLQGLHWGFALAVSGIAFVLLFLQTGLDLQRAGKIDNTEVLYTALKGLAMGTAGMLVIAAVIWAGSKLWGHTGSIADAVRITGLAFCATLLYSLCGLIINLTLQWNTAVAFGVTGLLWALNPVSAAVKQFTNEKTVPAIVLTTLCGVLLLAGWAYLGGAL